MPFRKIFRWMRRRNVVGEVPPVLEAKYPALAIVISPPDAFPDEQKIVTRLFDAGLSRFHLRKPEWTPARLREWVGALPRRHHAKLVVHAQPAVVSELRLGGLHLRTGQPHPGNWPQDIPVSQSCHSFGELTIYARHRAYAMLGPVFPSISKRDYTPQRTPEEYAVIINQWRTEVGTCPLLALGGLTPENIPRARALGFDGFAVVGSVWEADDPVEGFKRLRDAWTRK